jgi:hypothetical protein
LNQDGAVQYEIMNIAAGIAALKAAGDLTKSLRDAAKAGELKPDEFAGRVGEIYDYIIDSRAAVVDAQDEIGTLRKKLAALNDEKEFQESLKFDAAGIYRRQGRDGEELYCSACLDENRQRIRLTAGTRGISRCHVHGYRQRA